MARPRRLRPGRSVIAQVRRLEFNGPELLATLALGPHRLVVRLPAGQPIEDRPAVEMLFDLSRAVWFDQSTGAAVGGFEPSRVGAGPPPPIGTEIA